MTRRVKKNRRSSRRSTRRRGTRRRRRVSRNQRYVVANKRRRSSRLRSNRRRRRVRRNGMLGSVDWLHEVGMPILFGTVGFAAARYAGNIAAEKDWGTTDPKVAKTGAALVGVPLVFGAAKYYSMVARHAAPLVLGLGLAASEAWLRDTTLLGGSPAAAAIATPPGGTGSYYDYPTQGGQAVGAYYGNASLGADMVSTVTPTDMALVAPTMPQKADISERFAAPRGDRGYAGGLFARQLFSGMMGG